MFPNSSYALIMAFLASTGALLPGSWYLGYIYLVIEVWASSFQLKVITELLPEEAQLFQVPA